MSCCTAPTTPTANADPSNTLGLRRDLLLETRRRFRRLRGLIRRTVGYENDALELTSSGAGVFANADSRGTFDFHTRDGLVRAFMRWLRQAIDDEVLEPASVVDQRQGRHWLAPYIRAAAGRGYNTATGRLMQAGVSVEHRDLDAVFDLPVHRRQLRQLYTRAYENLESVSEETAAAVRDELTRGLVEGVNPREMADRLTDEVRDIQHTRAEVLARSEIVNSHTQEALTRYEQAPAEVGVSHSSWLAADDTRTCGFCRRLDGVTLTISEMRTGVVEWRGQVYRLAPPAHPNGRCSPAPAVDVDLGSLPPLEERVPGTVIAGG